MTYALSDASVRGGKPVELYKFAGTYENFYYTSGVRRVVYDDGDGNGPQTYVPTTLQRSEIVAGMASADGLDITVTMPVGLGLISTYAFQDSPPSLTLTIYRFHSLDSVQIYWTGPVPSISCADGIATVTSNNELTDELSRDFPNVYFQGPCNHLLFDRRCKVVEANYTGAAKITAINGNLISLDAIPSGASGVSLDGKLVGGEVLLLSGERRMIVSQSGVVVKVNFAFSRIAEGASVTIGAGCDHGYLTDCKQVFNNQLNFGGFPFIGTSNPFTSAVTGSSLAVDNTCLPARFEGWYWHLWFVIGMTGGTNPQTPDDLLTVGGASRVGSTTGSQWRRDWYLTQDYANETACSVVVEMSRDYRSGAAYSETPVETDGTNYPAVHMYCQYWNASDSSDPLSGKNIGGGFPYTYTFNLPADKTPGAK